MPITARLSRQFYERLGDEITNELVDWLNAVDASFRSELNDINERNWQRLRADMDARDTRIDVKFVELNAAMDARFERLGADMNARFEAVGAEMNARFETVGAEMNARFETVGAEMNARFETVGAALNARFETVSAEMNARFAQQETKLQKWMFGYWVTTLLAIAGLRLL